MTGATYSGSSYVFTYNDEGIRTSKTKDGVTTTYYLDGSLIMAEETNGNFTVYVYDTTGAPIGMRYLASGSTAWQTYIYAKNLQGDIVGVYNSSGTKLVSYTYDAWGNCAVSYVNGGGFTAAANNPFRYRGYYFDADLGLYYLNARYYDSNTGRFISADTFDIISTTPMGLTDKNLYAYCDNNPVVRVDNGGEFWNILIGAAVGAVVSTTISIASQMLDNPESIKTAEFWQHVGVSAAIGAVSGALAASGVGVLTQVAVNATLGAVGNIADAAIDGETDAEKYVLRASEGLVFGAASGLLGGSGSASKHTVNSFKRVLRNGNWSYYFSQINSQAIKDGLRAIPGIIKATAPTVVKTFIKTGCQYGV